MKRKIAIVVVNLISGLRFPIAALVVYLFWKQEVGAAVGAILFGAFTDWIDGALARWWNAETDFGRVHMEYLADSALLSSLVIGLGVGGFVPWWLMGAAFVAHFVFDFGIKKPFIPRQDRVTFLQVAGMQILMLGSCVWLLWGVDYRFSVAAMVAAPVVIYLKRRRIRTYYEWCFRKENES